MKRLLILLLLCTASVSAQTTVVTGTITDPQGNPYQNGTASAQKVVSSGQNPGPPFNTTTNAAGLFSFSGLLALSSPASYIFTICAAPVALGPKANPTPVQQCFANTVPIAISGASQDVSATLNALAPTLGPQVSNITGNALTATSLQNAPAQCGASSLATGITANGTANCTNSPAVTNLTVSGTGTIAQVNKIVYIDGTTNTTLSAYLAAPTANTTVVVPSNQAVSTAITVSVVGLKITCENGALITFTSAANFTFNGDRDAIQGCRFAGPGSGVAMTQAPFIFFSTNQSFKDNYYGGFGTTSSNGEIEVGVGASHFEFSRNTVTSANGDWDLYINNCCTPGATMTDFRVDNNDIGEFIAHATSATTVISGIVSTGNHFHAGQATKTQFCQEIGAFGGTIVNDVTSTANKCILTANGTNGGYSFSTVNQCTQSGDVFDANGFTAVIASFEHVILTGCTITGTVSNDGTGVNGLTCDRCSNSTFGNNTIIGMPTASSSYCFHLLANGVTSPTASNNTVTGTACIFPAAGTGHGIWVQTNQATGNVSNNIITGSTIKSDGTAGSQGITVEADTSGGVVANNVLGPNDIIGPQFGYNLSGVSGAIVTGTSIIQGINTAATPLNQTNTSGTNLSAQTTVAQTWTAAQTNMPLTTPTLTGVTNGTGLQLFNTATTCTTAATINTPCTTASITLPVGYADTNYRLGCSGLTRTNFPQVIDYAKSNTTFTITLNNLTAAAATYASFDCWAVHN